MKTGGAVPPRDWQAGWSGRGRALLLVLALELALCQAVLAVPFAREWSFVQPDGTRLRLRGRGDEFQAVCETLAGYTVVFVPEARAYCYARLAAGGHALESTGVLAGQGDPARLGLIPHLRIHPEAAQASARRNRAAWDQATCLTERWRELKAQTLAPALRPLGPPTFHTLGVKCGLTVLIDFEDEPGTVPQAEIANFLNGDNYRGFGNQGSVKQYFSDASNGRLTFTNLVTAYVTIPRSLHPRSYYNDVTKSCFQQGGLLVRDALSLLRRLPQYTHAIQPALTNLTVGAQGKLVSANFFVAGDHSGVWSYGIWGHQSALSHTVGVQALGEGRMVDIYQLSPIGDALELNTFCHENGHMLCGFPDLYDYGFDSCGGAANFCLMGFGASLTSPALVSAYLRLAAGWATAVDLTSAIPAQVSLASVGPDYNRFYRLRKPGTATEYFLLENRQKSGRDIEIPGSGVAIWHIDEQGNRDDQNLKPNTAHFNYEATLVQADNRWDLEFAVNGGEPQDLFYAGNPAPGYANRFSDLSAPSACWWDGTRSGLELSDFSANAPSLTFTARVAPLVIRRDPTDVAVWGGDRATFNVMLVPTLTNLTSIRWHRDGAALTPSARIAGVDTHTLTIDDVRLLDGGLYAAVITHAGGAVTSRVAQLTVLQEAPLYATNLAASGTTTIGREGLEVSTSGTGVGGTRDACGFAYRPVVGDFDARVRLLGLNVKSELTRAGLMVREGLSPADRQLSMLMGITPQALPVAVLGRLSPGGGTSELLAFPWGAEDYLAPLEWPPFWFRLKREGNRFTTFQSGDGSHWTFLKSVELDLAPATFVGVVAAAGAGAVGSATASFRHFQVLAATPTAVAIFTPRSSTLEGSPESAEVAVHASRNGPLELGLRLGGTARPGIDYLPVSGRLFIPAGTNVGTITITAVSDTVAEPPETVAAQLDASPPFEHAAPAAAKVLILDDQLTRGGLKRELYRALGGFTVAQLTRQMANPNARLEPDAVADFETAANALDCYGEVVSGYLVPPETGDYVFYLASNENAELWLSTDHDPAHARLVARVRGWTRYRDYAGDDNYSAPIPLERERYYYVRGLHKEYYGDDNFSVAWQRPGDPVPAEGSAPVASTWLAYALPQTNGVRLAPTLANVPAAGHLGAVEVSATTAWVAVASVDWITIQGDPGGPGNGRLTYQVAPNPTRAPRGGLVVVNGRTHAVFQEGALIVQLDPTPGGAWELTLDGPSDSSGVLEASSDLMSWTALRTNRLPARLDPRAVDPASVGAPYRFYRLRER
jgi:M6 family metalloprotease-like protein